MLSLLTGCISGLTSAPATATAASVSGNWQVTARSTTATLPSISGTLSGTTTAIKGVLHANGSTSCQITNAAFDVSGSADSKSVLTVTGQVAGGTFTLTGTLTSDGKAISNATYSVSGGTCAMAQVHADAQQYSDITGTYAGSFYDSYSPYPVIQMTAQLTQSPTSNTNGDFTLSGSATLPQNPCFNSPAAISNSQVTGGAFTFTYGDSQTGNSVVVTGSFSTDGKTLTVTNWALTGPCGPDSGTGTMTQQ